MHSDVLTLPYGGGGNTRAYFKGFDEAGAGLPRLVLGESTSRATTIASAIRIADPVHAQEVEEALERSNGAIVALDDDDIIEAWRLLAHEEGVFCEPASAASVAAAMTLPRESGHRVVCVITGHGLKDPESVTRLTPPSLPVDPDPDAIADAAR